MDIYNHAVTRSFSCCPTFVKRCIFHILLTHAGALKRGDKREQNQQELLEPVKVDAFV